MMQRLNVIPALSAGDDVTLEVVTSHLSQWRADTERTRTTIRELRAQVESTSRQLENPKAAFEYLDFFDGFFSKACDELDRLLAELPNGFTTAHGDTLRQLASNAAAEQRRTLIFRDKWVNKPLPYEQARPMLTKIASDIRDQLGDYREMVTAAQRLLALNPPPSAPTPDPKSEGLGRRELFSKLVRPLGERGEE